jgi:hypothetical protein
LSPLQALTIRARRPGYYWRYRAQVGCFHLGNADLKAIADLSAGTARTATGYHHDASDQSDQWLENFHNAASFGAAKGC